MSYEWKVMYSDNDSEKEVYCTQQLKNYANLIKRDIENRFMNITSYPFYYATNRYFFFPSREEEKKFVNKGEYLDNCTLVKNVVDYDKTYQLVFKADLINNCIKYFVQKNGERLTPDTEEFKFDYFPKTFNLDKEEFLTNQNIINFIEISPNSFKPAIPDKFKHVNNENIKNYLECLLDRHTSKLSKTVKAYKYDSRNDFVYPSTKLDLMSATRTLFFPTIELADLAQRKIAASFCKEGFNIKFQPARGHYWYTKNFKDGYELAISIDMRLQDDYNFETGHFDSKELRYCPIAEVEVIYFAESSKFKKAVFRYNEDLGYDTIKLFPKKNDLFKENI